MDGRYMDLKSGASRQCGRTGVYPFILYNNVLQLEPSIALFGCDNVAALLYVF